MVLIIVTLSFINTAASTMVNRGAVNIKVMASATGMNLTHAKDVNMVRLPHNPTKHNKILW